MVNDDEPPSPTTTVEYGSPSSSNSTLEYGSDLEACLLVPPVEASTGTKRKITSLEGCPPTNKGLRKLYDKFSSMSEKKRAKRSQLFKSMHVERQKNWQNVMKLSKLMSPFSDTHPDEFVRYHKELLEIKMECSYRRGCERLEEEGSEVSVDWELHIQETHTLITTGLVEMATGFRKTLAELRSTDCPHTPDEQKLRDLVEESTHVRKAAMGECELDDERKIVEAAYPHSICEERVENVESLEICVRTTERLVRVCDEIRDISKKVLCSALSLTVAENSEPWFRFNFLNFKD
jgi:hypothetical protein